jgi:hypothetical protein
MVNLKQEGEACPSRSTYNSRDLFVVRLMHVASPSLLLTDQMYTSSYGSRLLTGWIHASYYTVLQVNGTANGNMLSPCRSGKVYGYCNTAI